MDETIKLKLYISRDVHSEFIRKLLGKAHYETVFGDGSSCLSSSSSKDFTHSTELISPRNILEKGPSSPQHCSAIMSVFEFCVICDHTVTTTIPVLSSPKKRRNTIPPSEKDPSKQELNRKFTFSSLLTEVNDYSAHGIPTDLNTNTRSTLSSPAEGIPKESGNNSIYQPVAKKLEGESVAAPGLQKKELSDWMIKLETSRNQSDELLSSQSYGGNNHPNNNPHLMLNIASASTRLDESSFQGMVDPSMSSSLSTPTITESPNLSRSTSNENLQQLASAPSSAGASNNSVEESMTLLSGYQLKGTTPTTTVVAASPPMQHQHSYPFATVRQQPIIARRNPNIDRMISDAQSRSSPNGGGRLSGALSRSISASHSHSFYESSSSASNNNSNTNNNNGLIYSSMSFQSSSVILDGIAGSENKHVLANPHAKNSSGGSKAKPYYSLFPNGKKVVAALQTMTTNGGLAMSSLKASGSTESIPPLHAPPRLSTQEMINNRKMMARKMREFCVSAKSTGKAH